MSSLHRRKSHPWGFFIIPAFSRFGPLFLFAVFLMATNLPPGYSNTPQVATIVPRRVLAKDAHIPEVKIQRAVAGPVSFPEWDRLKSKIQANSQGRRDSLPPKLWKLAGTFNRLPDSIQNSVSLEVASDEPGDLWAMMGDKESILFERTSNRVLYRVANGQRLGITPNGKYLEAMDQEAEAGDMTLYRVSDMSKIPTPKGLMELIGKGRYAVVQKTDGVEWVLDLVKPSRLIKEVDPSWSGGYVFESEDGKTVLENGEGGISLYSLPTFKNIQDFPAMPRGFPFMNPAGTIVGSRNSDTVFLQNRATGKVKGYALDPEDLNLLVEIKKTINYTHALVGGKEVGQSHFYESEGLDKVWDLPTSTLVQSAENDEAKARELARTYFRQPYPRLRVNIIVAVLSPPNSGDSWILFNSSNGGEKRAETGEGDSVLVNIGGDLEIKKAFYYPHLLAEASWDEETSTIVVRTLDDDEYVRLQTTP